MELATRARVLHAFESRDFRLIWGGQTVSSIGNGAFLVAVGWRAVQLTGKPSSLALVLLVESAAMLLTLLVGGALADRYPRRTLMIVSDISRLGVVAGLAAVDATGHLSLPLLLAFAAGVGLGDGFFHPAFGGMVPLIVEQPLMASANALIGMSRNLSFVVGPALAAFLYARTGSSTVFAFDAWTFLFSALLLCLARPREAQTEVGESTWRDIASGIAYVARIPWLWVTIAVASVVLMVAMAPYQSLLPKLVKTHFHHGVGGYGTLFTFQAIGMVAGAVAFGQLNPRRHRVVMFFSGYAINDLCVVTMALVPLFWVGVALVAVRGVFIGFSNAMWETVLVELVPETMLSRVVSLDFFGSFGLTPVGYALTAGVAGLFTPSQILVVAFTLAAGLWLIPLASSRIRSAA